MLLLGGPVTIIPLLLFTGCARRLRLATVGLLQYIAPSGQLLMAVLVFNEPFGTERFLAFLLIWVAVSLTRSTPTWQRAQRAMAAGKQPRRPDQRGVRRILVMRPTAFQSIT